MVKAKAVPENSKQKARSKTNKNVSTKSNQVFVTGEERHQLIMQAAYFRAERRGFTPGAELDDWLQAEADIDGTLRKMIAEN